MQNSGLFPHFTKMPPFLRAWMSKYALKQLHNKKGARRPPNNETEILKSHFHLSTLCFSFNLIPVEFPFFYKLVRTKSIRLYSKINCMELNYLLKQAFVLHQSRSCGYALSSSLALL